MGVSAVFGFVICWLYRDSFDAKTANSAMVEHVAAIENAGKRSASKIEALLTTQSNTRRLDANFTEIRGLLADLSSCIVPASLHNLAIQRQAAINASAASRESVKAKN